MTRRVLGVALVCVLPFLTRPAAAAPAPVLRLTGRGAAYTDVTLPAGVRFDQRNARMVVRGGTYAAWWIARVGEPPTSHSNHAGSIRWVDPREPSVTHPSSTIGFRTDPLAGGRYRVYLATDGEATVDVPAAGLGRSRAVRPDRRTVSGSGTAPLTVRPGGVLVAEHRTPLRLPAHALAVASVRTVAQPGVAFEYLTVCLTEPEEDCPSAASSYGHTSSLVGDHAVRLSALYLPGTVDGPSDAIHRARGGPGVTRATADVFYLSTAP